MANKYVYNGLIILKKKKPIDFKINSATLYSNLPTWNTTVINEKSYFWNTI